MSYIPKYRAWIKDWENKDKPIMIYSKKDKLYFEYIDNKFCIVWNDSVVEPASKINYLMQFTGFKAKGQEIYEGDILGKDGYWSYYVRLENGAFRLIPCNKIQMINWEHNILTNQFLDYGYYIIGNIHENKELFNKLKNGKIK